MKKLLLIFLIIIGSISLSFGKGTTFTNEIFENAQLKGKIVVINSWNKTCGTCARQVKILNQAKIDFENVVFLSFEQTKDKDIAKFLDIDYWTTIVIYKNKKEISRSIGETSKEKIYSQIKTIK